VKREACGNTDQDGRRAKLELSDSEPLNDHPRSTTLRTERKVARAISGGGLLLCKRSWCRAERRKVEPQENRILPIGEETEVPDAHEVSRNQLQQDSAQKSMGPNRHKPLFAFVSGVAPTENDLPVGQRDQPMAADGHAIGVTTQMLEHLYGISDRSFRVDHPVLSEQSSRPRRGRLRLRLRWLRTQRRKKDPMSHRSGQSEPGASSLRVRARPDTVR
jgi:hypothetical protein